jgi:hypothetical protein
MRTPCAATVPAVLLLCWRCCCRCAEKRVAKGEEAQEAEMRTKLNSMRNDRLAAVAQQQAHERSMPVSDVLRCCCFLLLVLPRFCT